MKIKKYKVIDIINNEKIMKRLNTLSKLLNDTQIQFREEDNIVICYHDDEVIGCCCIAMHSPTYNFKNENNGMHRIPYLYNYICDSAYRYLKPSVSIMNYLKESLKSYGEINLHVDTNNLHAIQFYKKNNFKHVGLFLDKYYMYTYIF